MRALIIVDVQNDFLPGGSLAVEGGETIIPIVNELQKHFDCVVATKDWHPMGHVSFAVSHEGKKPGDVIEIYGQRQELWPIHCLQGSNGAEFSPKLDTKKIEKVFHKGTTIKIDSYSTFFDNAHLIETGLREYLEKKGIHELYIAGLALNFCVKYSVLDALKLGFQITVIEDACKGIEFYPGAVQEGINEMKRAGARFITSKDLISTYSTGR